MQVHVDQTRHLDGIRDVATHGSGVNLSQGIMQRFAIAQRLVDWRLEAVEDTQFKLVGTFEEVLEAAL